MLPNKHTYNDTKRPDTLYIRYPLLHSTGSGPYPTSSTPAGSSSDWFWRLLGRTEVPLSQVLSISDTVGKTWTGPKVTRTLSLEPALWFCPMCQHSWHNTSTHVLCPSCGLSVQCKHGLMATAGFVLTCRCGHSPKDHKRHWNGNTCQNACTCQTFVASPTSTLLWHDAMDLCALCNGDPLRVAKESINSEKGHNIKQVVPVGRTRSLSLPDADRMHCPECSTPRPVQRGIYLGQWRCEQCKTDLRGPVGYDPAIHKLWPESHGIVLEPLQEVASSWYNRAGKARQGQLHSIEAQWSLTSPYGVLTICGVCFNLAHDHHRTSKAGLRKLTALQKTRRCKWCNNELDPDYERAGEQWHCEKAPKHEPPICKRKWLPLSAKVPACQQCMALYPDHVLLEAKPDELKKAPDGRIARCHLALEHWHEHLAELQAEGVTLQDVLLASEPEPESEEQDYVTLPLEKIISGGQTGGDAAGLTAGKALGLQTGGFAPKGWRIDGGTCPELAEYGLVETTSPNYPQRTEENVKASDGTVIFGDHMSPGCGLTKRLCKRHGKPYFTVAKDDMNPLGEFQAWLMQHNVKVLNVAGNRERMHPGIGQFTYDFLMAALGSNDGV